MLDRLAISSGALSRTVPEGRNSVLHAVSDVASGMEKRGEYPVEASGARILYLGFSVRTPLGLWLDVPAAL